MSNPIRPLARPVCALICLALCTASASLAQLSGPYTIGSGGTYGTFVAAVTALTNQGVSGAVTFNVISGTYTEQIEIGSISGASAVHTITFQSQSGNAADVVLQFAPTSVKNYVLHINGADYITFQKITLSTFGGSSYGTLVRLNGNANGNHFANDIFNGYSPAQSSTDHALIYSPNDSLNNTIVTGNTFINGGYGVYIGGVSGSALSPGLQITNNTFTSQGYGGIFLSYQDAPVITGNVITGAGNRGMELDYANNGLTVLKNKITTTAGYGLFLYGCVGGTGLPTPRGLVADNFIAGTGTTTEGLYLYSSNNQDVYYNSVNMTYAASDAFYQYAGSSNSNNVVNNIFAATGGGYAYNGYTPAGIGTSDYNDLYSPGNYLASWNTVSQVDLAAFQSASGKDAHSISAYPSFTSSTDLHSASPLVNAKGTPLASVTDDIDGLARNGSTPDIGADEFTPTALGPMAGIYTIGGTTPSYTTVAAAISDLLLRGIGDTVRFNIRNGIYTIHPVLVPVPGSTPGKPVIFQSASGTAASVTLFYGATVSDSNYVFELNGADNITFQNLTLASNTNPGASYGIIFLLNGGVENLVIQNCILSGTPSSSSTTQAIVEATNSLYSSRLITGNTFINGGYGVYIGGVSGSALSPGLQITNNTFTSQGYGGIFLSYQDAPVITGNVITGAGNRGMELDYANNGLTVLKNKITTTAGYGLFLYGCVGGTGLPTPRGLVADNFIAGTGTTTEGLYLYSSNNQDVYYNSVNMTYAASDAFYQYAGSSNSNNVVNNIFAATGGGYAYNGYTPAGIGTSDYNDLYSPGNYLASWNTVSQVDLAAFQSASGKDAHSISAYPSFTSSTDLHSASPLVNAKGTPLASVTDDIDGLARNGSTPDIGADEFTPTALGPMAGIYTIGGTTPSYTTVAAAISDLLLRGIGDTVRFNIRNGIYTVHPVLVPVPGSTPGKPVIFQSASGTAASVTLFYGATVSDSNYVFELNGADNITFQNLTLASNTNPGASYGIIFLLNGGVENLVIQNCILSGTPSSSSTTQAIVEATNSLYSSRLITGNTFINGGYGVYIGGVSGSALSPGLQITNNTFTSQGYGGIFLSYQDAPVITGNVITGAGNRGMELDYANNGLTVLKNKITTTAGYGLFLYGCVGGTGLPTPRGLVADNFIAGTGTTTEGLYLYSSNNQDVYYNSVNMTYAASDAFYQYAGSSNSNNVVNNIFAATGGGYAYNGYTPAGIGTSDYNDLYSPGNYLASWNTVSQVDLAAFQSASGKDAHSISAYPSFTSSTDLHSASPLVNAKGTPLASVTDDIDGLARNGSTPDIGADEFTPTALGPMAGIYTIGGTTPSYTTVAAAISDLLLRGIGDTVRFNIRNGIYTVHPVLVPVPGSTPGKPVIFQSASGTAASVTLFYGATVSDSNYVFELNGADNITFQNLTLASNTNPGASYGIIFLLNGGVENLVIQNCILSGTPSSSSTTQAIVEATNSLYSSRLITGNTFINGGYGVYIGGVSGSALSPGLQITNNTFTSQGYGGIFLSYQDAPVITGNVITGAGNRGMELDYANNGLTVLKNKITTTAGYGLFLYGCVGGTGLPTPRGLVANNFIAGTGTTTEGLYLYSSNNQDVYYNSVNMTYAASDAFYQYAGSSNSNNVVNNIFAATGGGYAYNGYTPAGIGTSDYNDLTTTGSNLAGWNTVSQVNLAAFQSASGKDAHSVSLPPGFASSTDLHITTPTLHSLATPLPSSVTDDIDGESRDLNKPDIGADERNGVTMTFDKPAGWNLVSVPLLVSDYQVVTLFPHIITPAFAYQGSYSAKTVLENGPGYWVKYGSPESISQSGDLLSTDTISVQLAWNIIGSLSSSISVASIGSIPPGITVSPFFGYNGSYSVATTIEPGKGYWVKVSQSGKLILRSGSSAPMNRVHIVETGERPPLPPGPVSADAEIPKRFGLAQNYPNPFNPATTISYDLPTPSMVRLTVYDILGRAVVSLINGRQKAGSYTVQWDASMSPSGIYCYRLEATSSSDPNMTFTRVKKMVLIK